MVLVFSESYRVLPSFKGESYLSVAGEPLAVVAVVAVVLGGGGVGRGGRRRGRRRRNGRQGVVGGGVAAPAAGVDDLAVLAAPVVVVAGRVPVVAAALVLVTAPSNVALRPHSTSNRSNDSTHLLPTRTIMSRSHDGVVGADTSASSSSSELSLTERFSDLFLWKAIISSSFILH